VREGVITVLPPTDVEMTIAAEIASQVPGLHRGESEVIAIGITRRMPVVVFERRARRVAESFGASLIDVTELLIRGTADPAVLEERMAGSAGS
jgi:predicted nucleic acid-binding protein